MGIYLIASLVGACLAAAIAAAKNRGPFTWFVVGALLPVIALVALLCLPDIPQPAEPS